jgi:hypothetical protein
MIVSARLKRRGHAMRVRGKRVISLVGAVGVVVAAVTAGTAGGRGPADVSIGLITR